MDNKEIQQELDMVYYEDDIRMELEDIIMDSDFNTCITQIKNHSCTSCGCYPICKASNASWLLHTNYIVCAKH